MVCRSFQNFISRADPDTLSAFSGGNAEGIPPEMVKTASSVIGKMSPEELQRMVKLASSFQGENPFLKKDPSDNFGTGSVPPNVTPDMLKMATDMMSKMSPEEMQKMFEMASSLKEKNPASAPTTTDSSGSGQQSKPRDTRENFKVDDSSSASTSSQGFSNLNNGSQSSLSSSNVDLQEEMRNRMKDPAMRQVLLRSFLMEIVVLCCFPLLYLMHIMGFIVFLIMICILVLPIPLLKIQYLIP